MEVGFPDAAQFLICIFSQRTTTYTCDNSVTPFQLPEARFGVDGAAGSFMLTSIEKCRARRELLWCRATRKT
jgi:hypothetical protein